MKGKGGQIDQFRVMDGNKKQVRNVIGGLGNGWLVTKKKI